MQHQHCDPDFTVKGYLSSLEWQAVKKACERRSGSRDCWVCGQADGALPLENQDPFGTANQAQVFANALHHLTYRHFGAELLIDCVFLCTKHHDLVFDVEKLDGRWRSLTYYAASVKAAIEVGGGNCKEGQILL
jgi:hypothetical protein